MSTINRLSSVDALQPGDLIPVWDGSNGDTRKASLTTLLAFIESNFADPDYSTRIVAPNVDGFNVDIGNTGDSSWLIVNPVLNYTTGSITLPSTAYAVNDQEITVVFTAQVSSFSITGAGATVLGAPTQIGTYDSFRVRYNAAQLTWYTLDTTGDGSGAGTSSIVRQDFTGDGVVTTFALANAPAALGNELQVFIDGVYQERAGYSVSGNDLVFSEAPPVLSTIEVLAWGINDIGATTANLVTYTPAGTGAVAATVQDKLRESVSVLDFGAVGDGVTDDTLAIQAALNSGASVFLPSGTYNISSALTISTNGQEFIGQGKGKSIIKQTATNKNGIIITGNNVYVGHLQVRDIVRSSGSSEFSGVVWGAVDGTVIENVKVDTSDDSGIRCGYDLVGGVVVPSTNSKILNCEITNVVGQLGATGGGFGIEVIGAFDCICLGNDIEGVGLHGIRISGSSRCMVANNQIDNWAELGGGEGVHVSGGFSPLIPSFQNVVTGNILTLASNIASTSDRIGVYLADDAIDCVVSSNIITMSDANGYSQAGGNINGMWIRQGSGSSGVSTSRAVISNNVMKGSLYLGINASNYISQTLITDNIIRDFYAVGIQLGNDTGETVDSNISGNTIVGNPSATTAYGINNVGTLSGCVISNNIITDVGRAVELVGTINCLSLTGNTLLRVIYTGNIAYGIYVNATVADNVFISGNTISNIGAVSGDSFQYANLSAGAADKMYFYDNIIETAAASTVYAFQAGTGLIDVRYINTVQTLANDSSPSVDRITTAKTGGTTTITDFDDGVVGQELLILSDHAVTITDNAAIILAGGVNYVMKASDTLTLRMINDQVWNEVSRSVN
jgi:parallel beta-helix repeat protein